LSPASNVRGPKIVTPVAPRALGVTLIVGLIVALIVNLALRWLGQQLLDVPKGAPPNGGLIPATVFPVVGNCFGCFMSWRMPTRRSLRTFLGVGGFMTLVGVAISLAMVPSGANAGTLVTTAAIAVAPVLVIIPALLYLVSHQPEVPRPTPWWQETA
jgi:putative flippase GtrA